MAKEKHLRQVVTLGVRDRFWSQKKKLLQTIEILIYYTFSDVEKVIWDVDSIINNVFTFYPKQGMLDIPFRKPITSTRIEPTVMHSKASILVLSVVDENGLT